MTGNSSRSHLDNATLSFFKDEQTGIITSVFYTLVTVINLVGNSLSMWILIMRTRPKTASIIFMIHLTLTDLALGFALPFQIAYQLMGYHWTLGSNMCRYLVFILFFKYTDVLKFSSWLPSAQFDDETYPRILSFCPPLASYHWSSTPICTAPS